MLGANRKSVTMAAQALQTAGLISYRRGKIQIVDRAGLEKASCECYAIVKERFDAAEGFPALADGLLVVPSLRPDVFVPNHP
jgi:hypothetical protein